MWGGEWFIDEIVMTSQQAPAFPGSSDKQLLVLNIQWVEPQLQVSLKHYIVDTVVLIRLHTPCRICKNVNKVDTFIDAQEGNTMLVTHVSYFKCVTVTCILLLHNPACMHACRYCILYSYQIFYSVLSFKTHKTFIFMRARGNLVWCSHCPWCDTLNITIQSKIVNNIILLYLVF